MEVGSVINLKLLAHPVNWLIVWVVIIITGMAFSLARGEYGNAQKLYATPD